MSNTLTGLIPDLYAALDVVSRELIGFIPAVTVDSSVNRAAVGQAVKVPVSPSSNSMIDTTPAMSVPSAADQTIGNTSVVITRSKAVPFSWEGNEQVGLNSGAGYLTIRANQIAQAMRTLANAVELDLAALYATTSRAAGTVGTVPFITNTAALSAARKILVDNGAPTSDLQLVIDTNAGANLQTLFNINSARDKAAETLAGQGVLTMPSGVAIRESAQVYNPASGAMASATSTSAAFTVGQTVIPLATAGTGVVAAGDVITFANDTNQYVVSAVSFAGANPASGDTITLAAPGLRKAQGVATRAITVLATSPRNMAFSRSAIVLATRMPERPQEGDMAIDVMTIQDPRSGLAFEVSMYPGYRKIRYEIALAWGVKNIKPEHTATLLG
ncbi:P22 coat - protein 5 family protein [uncultured Agitococcus sp.]|uniref:P22 coat - protein 5 family protein n=1 Tax=uncultured Agitococcus sp. TaxID=1506599 RepID=UPI002605DF28|nr:P22 coat - protein 5 family protein [uncultured Agitococcus sp.]